MTLKLTFLSWSQTTKRKRDPVANKQQTEEKGQMQRGVSTASQCA
jgi:hypothetical protein